MKLLFINSTYPKEIEEELRNHSNAGWQTAANVFQWAIIDGLEQCGVDYTLACTPGLAAWPRFKKIFSPQGTMTVNGKQKGLYLRYCTLPVVNQLYRKVVIKSQVRKWCEENKKEDKLLVLCYTQQTDQLGPAIELKRHYPNLVVAPIVTDLIENAMDFADNRKLLKRIQVWLEEKEERKIFPIVDKYVLLSKYMTECIPEACDKYMVMEGIASLKDLPNKAHERKSDETRTLLYTGTFQEFGGLKMLVDAFMKTEDPRFRLILCGQGVLRQYVEQCSLVDKRIVYKGLVSHDEVVKMQRECTLLINPRLPNGGITKYSFPSKTMEYMSSRTPMIGYHLEGIPEEYYSYMFTPEDLTQEALTICINETLSLPLDRLKMKAEEAYQFIFKNKNSMTQVNKIISFLMA